MGIDWGDAPAWAALGAAVVSLGVGIWAVVEARRARRASERAATAGETSAQAAVRSADAAEKAHQLADQQYRDSLPPPVGWEIWPAKKGWYRLVNVGTETATGVTVDPANIPLARQLPTNETVRGNGGYVEFPLFGTHQVKLPNEIVVTWDGAAEPAVVPLHRL